MSLAARLSLAVLGLGGPIALFFLWFGMGDIGCSLIVRLRGRNDFGSLSCCPAFGGAAAYPQVHRQGMKRAKKEPRDEDRRVAKR